MKYLIATALSLFTCASFLAMPSGVGSTDFVTTLPSATPTPDKLGNDLEDCECPYIEVLSNLTYVKSGDTLKFRVEIDDENLTIPKFEWKVENGKIISGHGTSEIVVRSKQKSGAESVRATVELPVYSAMCICDTTFEAEVDFDDETLEASEVSQACTLPLNVTALHLDKEILTTACLTVQMASGDDKTPESFVVTVKTTAIELPDVKVVYDYSVSAGLLIGTGPTVQWDLSGVPPGKYTITAAVDDGSGSFYGQTQTRVVTISEPQCIKRP